MTVQDRLRTFIQDELAGTSGPLANDYPLIENGVIDSLGLLEIVQFIEREFGVEVADEDLVIGNFGTLDTIARLVGSKD